MAKRDIRPRRQSGYGRHRTSRTDADARRALPPSSRRARRALVEKVDAPHSRGRQSRSLAGPPGHVTSISVARNLTVDLAAAGDKEPGTSQARGSQARVGSQLLLPHLPAFPGTTTPRASLAGPMDLSLFFAGTAGSVPTPRRGLPALLLRAGGERILLDCGEGTQQPAAALAVGLPEIDAIFITHLHLDHWLGLPGMIKTFDMRDRDRPLDVFGPPGLKAAVRAGAATDHRAHRVPAECGRARAPRGGRLRRLRDRVVPGQPPRRGLRLRVHRGRPAGALRRRGGAQSSASPRARTSAACSAARPSTASRPSRSWGRTVPDDGSSTRATPRRSRASRSTPRAPTCWCTRRRSARTSTTARARRATRPPARRRTIALEANVKLLALTHLSTRYFPREIRDEARAVFENTVVPRDFDSIEVPFPERGEPHLVKAELVETAP